MVKLVVKELNLNGAKGVDTPSIKKKYEIALAESQLPGLDAEMASKFRSLVMRCAYLAQDRPDLQSCAKELAGLVSTAKLYKNDLIVW